MSLDVLKPVSSIMSRELITVHPKDSLRQVINIFQKHRIHHIPVVEYKKLVGLISKSDIMPCTKWRKTALVSPLFWDDVLVGDIMVTGLAVLSADDRIDVAIEVFKENILHAIPVVEGEDIVGIITTHDIISAVGSK